MWIELLGGLSDLVKALKKISSSEGNPVLTDRNPETKELCFTIERVLNFGLRGMASTRPSLATNQRSPNRFGAPLADCDVGLHEEDRYLLP